MQGSWSLVLDVERIAQELGKYTSIPGVEGCKAKSFLSLSGGSFGEVYGVPDSSLGGSSTETVCSTCCGKVDGWKVYRILGSWCVYQSVIGTGGLRF